MGCCVLDRPPTPALNYQARRLARRIFDQRRAAIISQQEIAANADRTVRTHNILVSMPDLPMEIPSTTAPMEVEIPTGTPPTDGSSTRPTLQIEIEEPSSASRAKGVRRHFTQPSRRLRNLTRRVGNEIVHMPEKLEPMGQFFFMRADAQPVRGLRDWTEAEWEAALEEYPVVGVRLVNDLRALGGSSFTPEPGPAAEARAIKERVSDALTMSEWAKIVEFQNSCLNQKFQSEQAVQIHYLDANLLSNYVFKRDFPLGVEDGVLRDRWKFAVAHSGLNTVRHLDSSIVSVSVYAAMGAATCCFVGYMMYIMMGKSHLWLLEATLQVIAVG